MLDHIKSVAVVLLVTVLSYYVYNSDLYFLITEEIGYFPYMALTPLASISMLYLIPGKTARNLMILFCILVYVDIAGWVLSGLGHDVIETYLQAQNLAFAVEVWLLIPRGIKDKLYGVIRRFDIRRAFAAP